MWTIYLFAILSWGFSEHPSTNNCPTPDAGPDRVICDPGQPVQINATINGPYDRFYWEPATGLSPANSLNPIATVNQTTTYRITVESKLPDNLIENGDFSAGNSGFSSEYVYQAPAMGGFSGWGVYTVHNRPSDQNNLFSNCPDITGEGLMFIADGALSPGVNFWCQTVAVQPNTTYEFSFWGTGVYPFSPSVFQVKFNGVVGGGPYGNAGTACVWQQFTARWNSGGNTSVEICLEDLNTAQGGNDFAIDDIRLVEVCERYDEVTIELVEIAADAGGPYQLNCDFPVIQLDGSGSTQGPGYTHEWTTFNGRIVSGHNTLFPIVDRAGTYILTVYGPGGCEKQTSVEVVGNTTPPEIQSLPADSLGCGTDSVRVAVSVTPSNEVYIYDWSGPGNYVSTEEAPWVFNAGTYYIVVTDLYGCVTVDSVVVPPGADVPALRPSYGDTLNCRVDSIRLRVDPLVNGQYYAWTGPGGFTSNAPEPMVGDTGWYYVTTGNDPGCRAVDSIRVTDDRGTVVPELASDTVTCRGDSVLVRADWAGGWPATSWEWRLPNGSVQTDSTLRTPYSGLHVFHATFKNGCERLDTIYVQADTVQPVFSLLPDTVTCENPAALLRAIVPGAFSGIAWTGPGGFTSGEVMDTVGVPGVYRATLTGENGCTATDSVLIERDADVPAIELFGDTLTCSEGQVALRWASQDTGLVFEWRGPGGFTASAPDVLVDRPGVYYLRLSNAKNCELFDSIRIHESVEAPVISLVTDSINCTQPTATLSAGPGDPALSYEWRDETGAIIGQLPDITVNQGGMYRLVVTAANGCSSDTTFSIRENTQPPDLTLSGDTIDCREPAVWVTGSSGTASLSYAWTGPGIVSRRGDSALVDFPGTYQLEVTAPNGCRAMRSVVVEADTSRPVLTLTGERVLSCTRSEVEIGVEGIAPGAFLEWRMLPSGAVVGREKSIMLGEPGRYELYARNAGNGCDGTAAFDVTQVDPPQGVELATQQPGCFEAQGRASVDRVIGGQGPYEVLVDGESRELGEFAAVSPGVHTVTVTDALGCVIDTSFVIAGRTDPVLTIAGVVEIASGGRVRLVPSINVDSATLRSIAWDPAGQVACPGCLVTWATPSETGTFTVTVEDANGCRVSASVLVRLLSPKIFVPNAFTPHNKDGVNDFFLPSTDGDVLIDRMQIFDRWGNLLWEKVGLSTNDPLEGWDGTSGDRRVLPGVYVYRIVFSTSEGKQVLTGDVTVL